MRNFHKCHALNEFNSLPDVKIELVKEEGIWLLHYASYATEQSIRDGEAVELGEEMSDISLTVRYCPYCGTKLSL
jgi:NADH pyrophosphatase NudC (nudix superfamily)